MTLISPATSNVEAKTRSPLPFSAGVDSPVKACWSIMRHPLDHVPVDRDDLAGVDDDDVAFLELVGRHLDLGRSAAEPDIPRLLAEARSRAASASCRAICLTRKRPKLRHQQQTAPGKIDMVPRQPTITTASSASTPIRFSSTNTRLASLSVGIDVNAYSAAAAGKSGRGHELGRRRQRERGRADGQVHVELVERCRLLGAGQRGVEDLDHLRSGQLLRVVVNQDRAGERIRREPVDPQHARQLALDRLAERFLRKSTGFLRRSRPGRSDLICQSDTAGPGGSRGWCSRSSSSSDSDETGATAPHERPVGSIELCPRPPARLPPAGSLTRLDLDGMFRTLFARDAALSSLGRALAQQGRPPARATPRSENFLGQ